MDKWNEIDSKFKQFEDSVLIPGLQLDDVPMVELCDRDDLKKIPSSGGCYWIWTNQAIHHSFHNHKTPAPFEQGEIIYNGIAKDDIRGRICKHLFGNVNEGMSAISIDILLEHYQHSHRKKALAPKGNTAFYQGKRIRDKNALLQISLSPEEKKFILKCNHNLHFRNGINITEKKHREFNFRVYFLSGFKSASFGDLIEKKWRGHHGLPRLCTYSKGR